MSDQQRDRDRRSLEAWNKKQERRIKTMQVVIAIMVLFSLANMSFKIGVSIGESRACVEATK